MTYSESLLLMTKEGTTYRMIFENVAFRSAAKATRYSVFKVSSPSMYRWIIPEMRV